MIQSTHRESIFAGRQVVISHQIYPRFGRQPLRSQFLNLILVSYLFRIIILQSGKDNTKRIVIISQLKAFRILNTPLNNRSTTRFGIFAYRLIEYKEVSDADLCCLGLTTDGVRQESCNTIHTTKENLSRRSTIKSSVREFIALYSIARVIVYETFLYNIKLTDAIVRTNPDIVLSVFAQSANNIIRQTILDGKFLDLLCFLIKTEQTTSRSCPDITIAIFQQGITYAVGYQCIGLPIVQETASLGIKATDSFIMRQPYNPIFITK